MNSKERVMAVLKGETPDRIPMGFWYHFPPESFGSVEETVKQHLNFYKETGVDVFKLMNENIFPYDVEIKCAADFYKVKPVDRNASFIQKQVEIVKQVVKAIDGQSFVLMTLHGTIASTWHARGGSDGYGDGSMLLNKFLHEDEGAMKHIFKIIADAMCILIDEVKDTGIDGIYYSALGSEEYLFTDEEYDRCVKEFDTQIFNHAMEVFPNSFLHICKDHNIFSRFAHLKPACINWGEQQPKNPSIEEGKKYFPDSVILGGFDNTKGPLINGTKEEIKEHLIKTFERIGKHRVMIGADCTLPSNLDLNQIRLVGEALKEIG